MSGRFSPKARRKPRRETALERFSAGRIGAGSVMRAGAASERFLPDSIVCDSSALISLADSCFLSLLGELRQMMRGDFIISETVKYEIIDHPLRTKSHTLPAIRLKLAVNDRVLRVVGVPGLEKETDDILWLANNLLFMNGKPLAMLQRGEAETLALARELGLKNVLIDERTTRTLVEDAEDMRRHLSQELHTKVELNHEYHERFLRLTERMNFFRSSELLVVAYERGLFRRFGQMERQAIEAALYGLKFAGCSISFEEIDEYVRSLRR